jgi:hypothetical protein
MDELVAAEPKAAGPTTGPETDAWWGAYSGWTMLPSMVLCVVLTGVIVLVAWWLVDRRHLQWSIWALAGGLWLVQMVRWGSRVFGHNYRLTTQRLRVVRGHYHPRRAEMTLNSIQKVTVRHAWATRWLDIGAVTVTGDNGRELVLDGVRGPTEIADRIRTLALEARAATSPSA